MIDETISIETKQKSDSHSYELFLKMLEIDLYFSIEEKLEIYELIKQNKFFEAVVYLFNLQRSPSLLESTINFEIIDLYKLAIASEEYFQSINIINYVCKICGENGLGKDTDPNPFKFLLNHFSKLSSSIYILYLHSKLLDKILRIQGFDENDFSNIANQLSDLYTYYHSLDKELKVDKAESIRKFIYFLSKTLVIFKSLLLQGNNSLLSIINNNEWYGEATFEDIFIVLHQQLEIKPERSFIKIRKGK